MGEVCLLMSFAFLKGKQMKRPSKYEVKCRLKKGDEVMIMSGKSKGETGIIETVDRKFTNVYITNKNLGKRHTKPDMNNTEGGIVDVPMPLDMSSVQILDPKTKKPTRIGYKVEGGKKVRFAKASGSILS